MKPRLGRGSGEKAATLLATSCVVLMGLAACLLLTVSAVPNSPGAIAACVGVFVLVVMILLTFRERSPENPLAGMFHRKRRKQVKLEFRRRIAVKGGPAPAPPTAEQLRAMRGNVWVPGAGEKGERGRDK